MKAFPLSVIGLALATLGLAAAAQQTTEVGKITVTGEGDKLGTGLLIDEDTPKAKSTVTKAQIDKTRSSGNPYQALALSPGVNATSFDATGLFGGNLRVRGFNSDQMGFTINGAPVNDSGSFSIFPQEYSDSENICELFVTQGATDTEAPHVGASGGNVGITTCSPEDKARGRVAMSAGQLSYERLFVRGDTGLIGAFKGFLSASKSQVNKWKGAGKANRDHIDAAAEYTLGNTKFSGSMLWNKAVTNNFRALNQSEIATYGYYADYSTVLPQHPTPVTGTAQTETAPTSAAPAYFGYSLNPFENYLINGKANIQLTPALRVDVEPYFWYGYGTGGTQQNTIKEGAIAGPGSSFPSAPLKGGAVDINGDGDTLDTVLVYRGSVTKTERPGVTTKVSYTLDNQRILAGIWYERARHRQTHPATTFDNNGNIADLWLSNSAVLVKNADGSLWQGRDTLTISTGDSVFVQDTIDLMNSKLQIVPSVSRRSIKRDFTNYPSSGTGATGSSTSAVPYQFSQTYSKTLPSLNTSYLFAPDLQGFIGIAKNFKVPGNFDYFGLGQSVTYTNGVASATGIAPVAVQPETSVNVDFGVRYKNDLGKISLTGYNVSFKNRIASSYNPSTALTQDYNVGDSTMRGVEVEVGTAVYKGFSLYLSGSYTKSTIDGNMQQNATTFYPTAGATFPDTPKGMAAGAIQWAEGPYLFNLSGKYTGKRSLTFVNDVFLGGYTTFDFNAAYKLPSGDFFKNPILRLNMSNLADHKYWIANSGSGSNISINAAGNPQAYGGAPRFTSVTLQTDF